MHLFFFIDLFLWIIILSYALAKCCHVNNKYFKYKIKFRHQSYLPVDLQFKWFYGFAACLGFPLSGHIKYFSFLLFHCFLLGGFILLLECGWCASDYSDRGHIVFIVTGKLICPCTNAYVLTLHFWICFMLLNDYDKIL